jgi:hypothetical protein
VSLCLLGACFETLCCSANSAGSGSPGSYAPALIILDSPGFDNDSGFQQRAKDFPVQTFIAQLVMEALNEVVAESRHRQRAEQERWGLD